MKKLFLAMVASSAFCGAVHAQSSVVLYGSIDAGLRDQTNTTPAGGNKLSLGSNGNYYSNRFGFMGTEDLGGGMKALFKLEAGFNSGTGALNNANGLLFQRQSYVGLSSDNWHSSLTLGRQYNVAHDTIVQYDPYQMTFFLPITEAAASAGGTSASDDNMIRYDGQFGDLHARAQVALGGQAGSIEAGSSEGAGFTYAHGPFTIGGAYTHRSHYTGPTIVAPFFNDNHYTMGGSYVIGPLKASLGYVSETLVTTSQFHTTNRYLFGGLRYAVTPLWTVTGAYYALRNSTADVSGRQDVAIISAVYALSKRTQLYADIDNTHYTGVFLHNTALNASGHSNSFGASAGINVMF